MEFQPGNKLQKPTVKETCLGKYQAEERQEGFFTGVCNTFKIHVAIRQNQ